MTKYLNGQTLYEKYLLFSASLLKRTAKMFKKSALVLDHYLLDDAAAIFKEPLLPEYDMIFRQWSREKTEAKKSAGRKKIQKIFKNDEQKAELLKKYEEQKSKFDFCAQEAELFSNVPQMDVDQILEKYCILTMLVNNWYRRYIDNGINPFSVTIF